MRAIGIFFGLLIVVAPLALSAGEIQYSRDIRPILSQNCFQCHGPDAANRKGGTHGLRLDTAAGATENLGSGEVAIEPGHPEKSELVSRINSEDPDEAMPLKTSGKKLSQREKELLAQWIKDGAKYTRHWSYVKPERPPLPSVADKAWPRNEIDAFILARLEKARLKPSPEADRRVLIRRLYFDLLGLPPKPEEADAFVSDKSPDAYERLVDKVLASPRYGERMAIGWLDVVRYADTVGYHSDNPRNVWPYRDYVIRAFNDNKPFDQFTIEQLAGDLLPGSTPEQKVASCFNRLLLTTEEGGAQAKDYEARMLTDRVRAMGTVWLGQTLGCCNCHDHKFDPMTQRDFFAMGAFFADIQEPILGRREDGMAIPDPKQIAELARLDTDRAAAQKQLDEALPGLAAAEAAWEASIVTRLEVKATWTPLDPETASSDHEVKLTINGDETVRAEQNPKDGVATYQVTLKSKLHRITALRLEALSHKSLPSQGPGRASNGNFVLTEFQLFDAGDKAIALSATAADFEQSGFPAATAIDGRLDQPHGWGVMGGTGANRRIDFELKQPLVRDGEVKLKAKLFQLYGQNHTIAYFRISATGDPNPLPTHTKKDQLPPAEIVNALKIAPDKRDAGQKAKIAEHYKSIAPELAPLRAKLAELKKQRAEVEAIVPKCLVSVSTSPRVVHVLARGNFLAETGEPVQPAVPHFLPQPTAKPDGQRLTRLDLARWVVSPDNPLTPRVFVNRIWKQLFGIGLSKTLDDLGSQGETPVNPELLDWLACDFVEHGWDIKHLIRTIVLTHAYRQSSIGPDELLARDPANRLLARQSRFRLEAELVRDNALAVSGLLVEKIGGPSVKPYQPDGYWENLNFPQRTYDADKGEDQYRRGLYTWWQRTFMHPSLLAFDAPSREECVAERNRSCIPQQALVLLNDPSYVEAARAFAARIMKSGGNTDARLDWAWKQALQRPPRDDERAVAKSLLDKQLARFAKAPDDATKLLHDGLAPPPADLPPAELAAWTSIARVILNLHETITRE
jgi:hypothetical protein